MIFCQDVKFNIYAVRGAFKIEGGVLDGMRNDIDAEDV